MPVEIRHQNLQFRYPLVDIRQFDAERYLESGYLADNLFAVLCRTRDRRQTIHRILDRIAKSPSERRGAALTRLLVLSGLRGLSPIILEERRLMPVIIDPMENEVLRNWYYEALEKGREERRHALRETLASLLVRRFGSVPEWATHRIQAATDSEMDSWILRILDAKSIEDVFR